jgi:hypothetical protein
MDQTSRRPLAVILAYWHEVMVIEENATVLAPVYLEVK